MAAVFAAFLLALLIGLSRMYLGVLVTTFGTVRRAKAG